MVNCKIASSYRTATVFCFLLWLYSAQAFSVVTVNSLAQTSCQAKPTGMPSFTQNDINNKKGWLLTMLTEQIANKNIDFATVQEVDAAPGSGKSNKDSSIDDVMAWAEDEEYIAIHTQPNPNAKPSDKAPNDVAFVLLKKSSFPDATVNSCTFRSDKETGHLSKWLWCEGLKIQGGQPINVLAGHAPSSGPDFNNAEFQERLKAATMIVGDMNMDASGLKAGTSSVNAGDLTVYPDADSGLVTTAKDAFKYRKLSQAMENTHGFQNAVADDSGETTCTDIQCKPKQQQQEDTESDQQDDEPCCDLTNEKHPYMVTIDGTLQNDKNVCKYASRICALADKKNKAELKMLAGSDGDTTDRLREFVDKIDLKSLYTSIGCADTDCGSLSQDNLLDHMQRTLMQEDLVAIKAPLSFETKSTPYVYPLEMTTAAILKENDNGQTKQQAQARGFPTGAWPSDHFLVAVEIVVPEEETRAEIDKMDDEMQNTDDNSDEEQEISKQRDVNPSMKSELDQIQPTVKTNTDGGAGFLAKRVDAVVRRHSVK
uniref:Endonuclease/exonuclease/phosphatase domain-containing protein n=1 Tax=Chromera velia CCMP2878 TaxID=1169474 RepID=A0A0G4H0D1_9ALVE|eukprot:Cvel_24085.t1-p1 / transcript=Cvel_24085.t1 / gene=Cvel_24085 / organism=Chromera_velia_CCMP2878 / gene_product=hypothetical protein / transcript_product=hypothetical protein / location=Cvel_scaffold2566:19577-21316(+) / protein_length=540 / sequence_SO=supercontig / SO=protein_coding / is_pseudo=false